MDTAVLVPSFWRCVLSLTGYGQMANTLLTLHSPLSALVMHKAAFLSPLSQLSHATPLLILVALCDPCSLIFT